MVAGARSHMRAHGLFYRQRNVPLSYVFGSIVEINERERRVSQQKGRPHLRGVATNPEGRIKAVHMYTIHILIYIKHM